MQALAEKSKFRRFGRLTGLILVQILLTLLLLEIAVRLLTPLNENLRLLNYNPRWTGATSHATSLQDLLERSHRGFRPFTDVMGFRTNSHGLRSPEYDAEKSADLRVVALGDSFTFAGITPYRKHWPKLLETRLQEDLGASAEVINLGYPSVGPKFELRMWQLEGSRLNADVVVQAFYVGNDFLDGLNMQIAPFSVGQALLDYSAFYRITRNLYRHRTMDQEEVKRRTRSPKYDSGGFEVEGFKPRSADQATFRPKRFNGIVARTMQVARISNRTRFEEAFQKNEQILLETRRAIEATGARYLLMIIPAEFQVDPEVARGGLAFKKTKIEEYEVDWAQTRFASFCDEYAIECLDLLPAFQEEGKTKKLYWLRNTHWNVEGHALAVAELVEHFRGSLASRD